jgi:hypothetical protein
MAMGPSTQTNHYSFPCSDIEALGLEEGLHVKHWVCEILQGKISFGNVQVFSRVAQDSARRFKCGKQESGLSPAILCGSRD